MVWALMLVLKKVYSKMNNFLMLFDLLVRKKVDSDFITRIITNYTNEESR